MRQLLLASTGAALLILLAACSNPDRCVDVEIVEGCKARCKEHRPAAAAGATTICAELLQISRVGENNILQTKNRQVTTRKLPERMCFDVKEGQITDAATRDKLVAACGTP